jgi:hypothetical protein
VKLGKPATETPEMLHKAFEEHFFQSDNAFE